MSNCLSQAAFCSPNLPSSRFSYSRRLPISGGNCAQIPVRAAAADGRQSLDHLQRQNKQQQQAKRRAAPVAPIGLWDRFPRARTVQQMMETMERMMDDPLAYSSGWPSASSPTDYGRGRTPWEIKEVETEYKLRFDMPGMTKADVKVWIEEKMLVVKAQKQPPKTAGEDNGEDWSASSYGKYSCRIALPENVELDKIKAEVKDGVLYINIPKATTNAKVFDISVN